jgi:hypothetical protein
MSQTAIREYNYMALVIGDLHGNIAKACAFFCYEPDVVLTGFEL